MAEHTALPLKVIEHEANLFSVVGKDHFHFASTNSKTNARFIVTACNCHADLLEALKSAVDTIKASGLFSHELVCLEQAEQAIRKVEETR